jgi:hypothetical protein
MGAYNVLKDTQVCYSCGNTVNLAIQFKYGELWLYTYKIRDSIIWGKKNIGNQNEKKVVVSAFSEECPVCNAPGIEYEVFIENGKIVSAQPLSRRYDFVTNNKYYIVIDE